MIFLPDNAQVYSIWRRLVVEHNGRGVQVHDAHLAATMQVHGVGRILTLNRPDFLRYADVQAVHPSAVAS
jgi:predicted nucleic acid-binding protein